MPTTETGGAAPSRRWSSGAASSLVVVLLAGSACGRSSPAPSGATAGQGPASAGSGGAAGQGASGGLGGAGGEAQAGEDGGRTDTSPGGSGGAGLASDCLEGTAICDGPNSMRFCLSHFYGTPTNCPLGCHDGHCNVDCVPGTAACFTHESLRVCGDAGVFLDPTPCAGACSGDTCLPCTEGDTRCVLGGQQTCTGGTWAAPLACPFVCVDRACGQRPKIVFVTSDTFEGGSLSGPSGIDGRCQKDAVDAHLPGQYFAWLGSPVERFTQDAGPYTLVDGTIVADNLKDLTSGLLRHRINFTERGGPPPQATGACGAHGVWTSTTTAGREPGGNAPCNGWSDPTSGNASWGSTDSLDKWSDGCSVAGADPAVACLSLAPLFCFQQ